MLQKQDVLKSKLIHLWNTFKISKRDKFYFFPNNLDNVSVYSKNGFWKLSWCKVSNFILKYRKQVFPGEISISRSRKSVNDRSVCSVFANSWDDGFLWNILSLLKKNFLVSLEEFVCAFNFLNIANGLNRTLIYRQSLKASFDT